MELSLEEIMSKAKEYGLEVKVVENKDEAGIYIAGKKTTIYDLFPELNELKEEPKMEVLLTSPVIDNWVNGKITGTDVRFETKVFAEPSKYGINNGKVSKLLVRRGNGRGFEGCFVNYDRGWDIKPLSEEERIYFNLIYEYLENYDWE